MDDDIIAALMSSNSNSEELPPLPDDSFNHNQLAGTLLKRLERLREGSCVALRGCWGRGKTDLLNRLARIIEAANSSNDSSISTTFKHVLTINPWKAQDLDLLTPLIAGVWNLIEESDRQECAEYARLLVKAGYIAGLHLLKAPISNENITNLVTDFGSKLLSKPPSSTEVGKQIKSNTHGIYFHKLVSKVIKDPNDRILVLIDDLDRCLPDKQLALLESMHFLLNMNPRAIFVVAIDPEHLRKALMSRHAFSSNDADGYVEKIFDFSQELVSANLDMRKYIYVKIDEDIRLSNNQNTTIRKWFQDKNIAREETLWQYFSGDHISTELRNPRVYERAFLKLRNLVLADPKENSVIHDRDDLRSLFPFWVLSTQRWPSLREAYHRLYEELSPHNFKDAHNVLIQQIGHYNPVTHAYNNYRSRQVNTVPDVACSRFLQHLSQVDMFFRSANL
ncbi:MAG: hypothetical protein H6815_05615 [Phycisphaeraceae bacterium]|nr:hypothetical protein [Phycisphaerales bacterium]MCB9859915.1 hypothetical protein [Phycisphaeraceae bacterium]